MQQIAAIDIGSNAMRLAIARFNHEQMNITYRTREPVRLGSSVFGQGEISDEIYEDLRYSLLQFKNQLENHKVSQVRAVATSAMREARNGPQVIESLYKDTGIQVELISGDEEARLVTLAIGQKLDLNQGRHLLIDIGGGSIELIAIEDGRVFKKQSFVIGMVRVLELAKNKGSDLTSWLPQFIQEATQEFISDLPPMNDAVGSGGSMDRFIKLKSFVSSHSGEFLTHGEMQSLQTKLLAVPYKERILKFGLKSDRADVIIPAAIATNQIMYQAQCDKIHFPQVGLKDGVLWDMFRQLDV
jgi:exopolyphosphatase / guanosine-5'-triphosphate,3'-diphosphate pyrophosphatase